MLNDGRILYYYKKMLYNKKYLEQMLWLCQCNQIFYMNYFINIKYYIISYVVTLELKKIKTQ